MKRQATSIRILWPHAGWMDNSCACRRLVRLWMFVIFCLSLGSRHADCNKPGDRISQNYKPLRINYYVNGYDTYRTKANNGNFVSSLYTDNAASRQLDVVSPQHQFSEPLYRDSVNHVGYFNDGKCIDDAGQSFAE